MYWIDSISPNLYILFYIRNHVTVSYYDHVIFNTFKALTDSQNSIPSNKIVFLWTKLYSIEQNCISLNKTVFHWTKLLHWTKLYSIEQNCIPFLFLNKTTQQLRTHKFVVRQKFSKESNFLPWHFLSFHIFVMNINDGWDYNELNWKRKTLWKRFRNFFLFNWTLNPSDTTSLLIQFNLLYFLFYFILFFSF